MPPDDKAPKTEVVLVHAIEQGGQFTEDGHAIIRLKLAHSTVPVAFTVPQLLQLLPQLSGLLGKLKGDSGIVWKAENWRISRTLDDALRLDFSLHGGATISVSIPMAHAGRAADRMLAEAAKRPNRPPAGQRH